MRVIARHCVPTLAAMALAGMGDPAAAQDAVDPAAIALPEIAVTGTGERANGPVAGFAAKRSATGTKTDAAIAETPAAITVIPRDQMDVLDARSLNEALRYTAGINTQTRGTSGTRYDQLSFRGFGSIGGVNTTYLNGMRLLGATYIIPQIDDYALERIEVLKGPASVLYGQASPAGLINLVSKRPTDTPFHELGIEGGSFGTVQGTADLSGKLTEDGTLLGRITGLVRNSDGWVTSDYGRERRVMLQPSATYHPDANTTVTLLGFYQRDPYGGYYGDVPQQGSIFPNPNGRIPLSFYDGDPSHEKFDRTQYSVGYEAEHRFNDAVTVRQNFRYFHVQGDYASVYGNGLQSDLRTLIRGVADSRGDADTYTADTQAQFRVETGPLRHTLLGGIDYIRSDADTTSGFNTTRGPTLDLFAPVYHQRIPIPPTTVSTFQTLSQLGVYAQDQIRVGNLTVLLGGRQDFAGTDTDNRLARRLTTQFDRAFSGRAGIIYNFENGLAPYYSYAESFQPTAGTDYTGAGFRPSRGTSHELGVKYAPPGIDGIVTADVFDVTQSDVLTTDPVHPTFSIQTGAVRSRGVEVEVHASPTPALDVVGAYTYVDATYTSDNSGLQGKELYAVPRNNLSAFADYTIPTGPFAGLGFGGGARYFSSSEGNALNTFRIPGRTLFDAVAHYDVSKLFPRMGGARLQVNASNIADTRYISACYGSTWCFYGPRRLVLASLRYRW